MFERIALEDQLILAAARTGPDLPGLHELASRQPDWEAVLRKVQRFGVASLVYTSLRRAEELGSLPKVPMDGLRVLYHREVMVGTVLRDALTTVLQRFAEASIPAIPLRGAALATFVYPSPGLRRMAHVDLLVRNQDIGEAGELVRQSAAKVTTSFRLHPQVGDSSHRLPVEEFWQRAQPARIHPAETLMLSPGDLLVHLAAGRSRLRTLCDLTEVCRQYESVLDWSVLAGRARSYRLSRDLYYTLRLARDLVGARVPTPALKDLRAGFRQSFADESTTSALLEAILSEEPAVAPTLPRRLLRGLRRQVVSQVRRAAAPWRRRSQTVHHKVTAGDLAVTYDSKLSDGVGSQLQRIYGIYAVSRALGVKYVHTPLGRVGYQGLLPLLTGQDDPDFSARYNAFFTLPSDPFDLENCERIPLTNLSEKNVEQYRQHALSKRRPVLLQSETPFGYTDRFPAAYLALRDVSPYRHYRASGPIRIAIHLRRGDNVTVRLDRDDRLLPNSYYLHAAGVVIDALRREGAPFQVRLHTEMPPRPYTLYPDTPGLYCKLERASTIDPADFALEEFDALPNLEIVLNAEPQAALDDFATADVLILSLSSFGYLGGLLNPHGLVVYAPWWHAPVPGWLVAENRQLDAALAAGRIAEHLRRRGQP